MGMAWYVFSEERGYEMNEITIEEAEQTDIQCQNCGNPYYKGTFTGWGDLTCKTCNYDTTMDALLHGVTIPND